MWRSCGIVLLLICGSWYHPIHVSVTNIDLEPSTGTMQLSVKIFSDDFQDMIFRQYGVRLNIVEQMDPGDKIAVVNDYIENHLQIEINGRARMHPSYLKAELNEEAIWLYYQYQHEDRIRQMKVDNRIMLDHFDDQTNLVIIAFDDMQNGYRLNNKKTEFSLDIKALTD